MLVSLSMDSPIASATPAAPSYPQDLFGLSCSELQEKASLLLAGRGAGIARRVFCDLYARGSYTPVCYGLKAENAAAWKSSFDALWLEPETSVVEEGEYGRTIKTLFRCSDGQGIETVLIPMPEKGPGRASLCVSSQVGCRMGCAFCQTASLGLVRNLSPGEIVSQVMTARFRLGWSFQNIVFMGMGEPLDNAPALIAALGVLTDQAGLHIDAERITVCTSGPPDGIEALAAAGYRRMGLSISLNGAKDETRSALMPINRAQGLASLKSRLSAYPRRRNFVLGVNYCLLPGLNDSWADVDALQEFLSGLGRVLVNVIPYNPGRPALALAPSEAEILSFIDQLKARGIPVRRRLTKGRDIMAACGQLGAQAEAPSIPSA